MSMRPSNVPAATTQAPTWLPLPAADCASTLLLRYSVPVPILVITWPAANIWPSISTGALLLMVVLPESVVMPATRKPWLVPPVTLKEMLVLPLRVAPLASVMLLLLSHDRPGLLPAAAAGAAMVRLLIER